MNETLFKTIDDLKDKYLEYWKAVCSIESFTSDKQDVDKVGSFFIEKAKELGLDIEVHKEEKSGDVIAITLNKESKEKPIIISGHMDTVFPKGTFEEPIVRVKDGIIYGPGVADCKGGTIACLLALEALKKNGFDKRPVIFLLQADEEVGSRLSNKDTINWMISKSKDALCFINTEMYHEGVAIIERKGIMSYEITVNGKAVHASICPRGLSAILEATYKIQELEKYKNEKGITINTGKIIGGTAINVVPEQCIFNIDCRFMNAQEEKEIEEIVMKTTEHSYLEGTISSCKLLSKRVAMEKSDTNVQLLDKMNEIWKASGLSELKAGFTAGGSDASNVSSSGIPCVDSLGVKGGEIHSKNEFAYIDSLCDSAKRIASTITMLKE